MDKIQATKNFKKQYKKLPRKVQMKVLAKLEVFANDEYNQSLRNHALRGKYQGYRSIDISGDVRALYYKKGTTIIIFAFVGTHAELYG